MINSMLLNDNSCCNIFCPFDDIAQNEYTKRQKNARIIYSLGIILIGIFTFFVKNYATKVFWFLRVKRNCFSNTELHSCFTLVMIYWISCIIALYHLILMIFSFAGNMKVYWLLDYFWTIKILIFLEGFFIFCTIPNIIFTWWAMFFKYYIAIFITLKTIFLNDAIFFFFNKNRFDG